MTETLMTPPPTTRRRRWLIPAVLGLAAALLLSAGTWWYLNRGSADDGTLTLSGKVVLTATGVQRSGAWCYGKGGFSDVTENAQVIVTDAAGATVAIGRLGPGSVISGGKCEFSFTVSGVPSEHQFYGVTVSSRKGPQYSKADLARPLTLTLG